MTTMTMYFLLAFLLIVSVRVRRERNIRKDRARQIGSLYDSSARKESEYARARDRMAPFVTDSRLETFSAMFADASLCFKEAVGYLERVVSEDLDAERWGDLVRDAEEWLGLMEDITLRLSGSELIVSGLERKIAEAEEVAVGESELSAWLVQNASRYGMSPDAFAQALVQADQLPMAISDIRRGKALAVVTSKARVVDASGRPVDLEAIDEQVRAAEAAFETE